MTWPWGKVLFYIPNVSSNFIIIVLPPTLLLPHLLCLGNIKPVFGNIGWGINNWFFKKSEHLASKDIFRSCWKILICCSLGWHGSRSVLMSVRCLLGFYTRGFILVGSQCTARSRRFYRISPIVTWMRWFSSKDIPFHKSSQENVWRY